MGEALFEYIKPADPMQSFFHHSAIGKRVRDAVLDMLEWIIEGQLGLKGIGLMPNLPFETVAQSTISLSTEGLYDKVRRGLVKLSEAPTSFSSDHRRHQSNGSLPMPSGAPICLTELSCQPTWSFAEQDSSKNHRHPCLLKCAPV